MAQIKIFGDSAVVVSAIKTAEIETLKKFKPEALKLVEKENGVKNELFAIALGNSPMLTKHGVIYAGQTDNGNATATISLPTGMNAADKAKYVRDNYGYAILALNKLENQIAEVLELTADEFETMDAAISTVEIE